MSIEDINDESDGSGEPESSGSEDQDLGDDIDEIYEEYMEEFEEEEPGMGMNNRVATGSDDSYREYEDNNSEEGSTDEEEDDEIDKILKEISGEGTEDNEISPDGIDDIDEAHESDPQEIDDVDETNESIVDDDEDPTIPKVMSLETRQEMCAAQKGESKLIQFPFALALDSTRSQAQSRFLIIQLFKELRLTHALSYTLVTFNDCRRCLTYHPAVKPYPTTTDFKEFLKQLHKVNFANGGDPKERLFPALYEACERSPQEALIVATTDEGTKDLRLEQKIKECLKKKRSVALIATNPEYKGDQQSMDAYKRVAHVVNIRKVGVEGLEKYLVNHAKRDCFRGRYRALVMP